MSRNLAPRGGRVVGCHPMPYLHLVATVFMAGVIVFVQIVHYPLMARVGVDAFPDYQAGHTVRTGWVVIPAMVTELGTAAWLVGIPPSPELRAWSTLGLALLGVIWLSTALVQAPAHGRLMKGFDAGLHRWLVRTNWVRTVAWAARVPVAVVLLG